MPYEIRNPRYPTSNKRLCGAERDAQPAMYSTGEMFSFSRFAGAPPETSILRRERVVIALESVASRGELFHPQCIVFGQGDASGLWPRESKRNIGAGITYPPGVKPSFAKGPLKGRWPVMAAAAAAELRRAGSGDTVEAAPFLLSVCVCGLLAAEQG